MFKKSKTAPIVLVSVFLGLGFDWLFYGKLPGVSVFIYTSLILGFMFYFAYRFKQSLNKSIFWLVPVILFFSLMVFVRANPFLAFINIVLIIYLLMLVARLAYQPSTKLSRYEVTQYLSPISGVPLSVCKKFLQVIQSVFRSRSKSQSKSSYLPIIRGLILSLPVLFIFLILLSSADLVFKEYLGSLINLSVNPETVFRWGLIGFVASLFTGAYALIFMPPSVSKTPVKSSKKFDLGTTESSIILGSVSVLFLAFVLVQLTYLFGGSQQLESTDFTYAEYARKGFFELIAVATISLLLIWIIKKCTNFKTLTQTTIFKLLSGVLLVEVMLIMLSAHLRLNLYEDTYGFTTLRLMSHLFIIWLSVAFVLLLINIVKEKNENQFALHIFVSVISFFALFNLINPDAFIAQQNINRFNDSGKLDIHYLRNLSEDATPNLSKLLDHPDKEIQRSTAGILYEQKEFSTNQSSHWQSVNLGRHQANQIFRDKWTQIETGKLYIEY